MNVNNQYQHFSQIVFKENVDVPIVETRDLITNEVIRSLPNEKSIDFKIMISKLLESNDSRVGSLLNIKA